MDDGACSYLRFLKGEKNAFDSIIRDYFDSLVFFINRYVHDIASAEDIAIDTFSDLIAYPHRYNFKVSLKTYIFMLGRSKALNYLKHNKILTMVELSNTATEYTQESVESSIINIELKENISSAIEKLPEDMRAAVHLFYFEDLSYKEIAKIMKKNHKQIDNLLYRAKSILRNELKEEGEILL